MTNDDERLLLMLTGERPGGGDGQASAELRDAVDALDGPLSRDAARQTLPPAHAAARAVVAAMQDAAVARDVAAPRSRRPLRLPRWVVYPAAAAAVLGLLMSGWWYTVHRKLNGDPAVAYTGFPIGEPMLTLRGMPEDVDPAEQDDDALARQFDSIIIDQPGGGEAERQFAAMKFLEESVQ